MIFKIKYFDNWFDLTNVSIRFEQVNNLFLAGSSPGMVSYPTEMPLTDHNLKILNNPQLLENAQALTDTITVEVYLNDNFWFKALMYYQTISTTIKFSLIPAILDSYNRFQSKLLKELDFGQFNEYYLPETYRYFIGRIAFQTGDSIAIKIGDGTTSTTYTQVWTTDYVTTVQDFITQVNANTLAKITLLKLEYPYPDNYYFTFLVKGVTQFSYQPSQIDISSVNYASSIYVDYSNDSSIGMSAEAVHMKNVTDTNIYPYYKLAFGDIPWKFPIIYNPGFFGEVDALNIYDDFINTYKVSSGQFLIRQANNTQQNNALVGQYPSCPQIFLQYILETAFANFGLKIDTTFFDDPEWANLLMLNLYHQSKRRQAEGIWLGPQFYEMKRNMPAITVQELTDGMKSNFALFYYYNFSDATVSILSADEIFNKLEPIDINDKALKNLIIQPKNAEGITLSYQFDNLDTYPASDMQGIDEYLQKADVNLVSNLPTSSNVLRDVRLVYKDNQIYLVNVEVTPNTWEFFTENLLAFVYGDGKQNISSKLAPMLMIRDPKMKTGAVSTGEHTYDPTYTNTTLFCPKVNQKGNSAYHKLNDNLWSSRLMIYRGLGTWNYPLATYDKFFKDGTSIGNRSLKYTHDEGLFNTCWKSYVNNMSSLKKQVAIEVIFDAVDLLNFKIQNPVFYENQKLIVYKMSTLISNKNDTIEVTKLDCYKK